MENNTIIKSLPVPAYHQLRNLILKQIKSGEWNSNCRIPSETEFCKKYGISRITARGAIKLLVNEGLLYTIPGKGTFFKGVMTEQSLEYISSFFSQSKMMGFKASIKVISEDLLNADEALCGRLNISLGEEVLRIIRVKYADGSPVSLEKRFIPHKYCPGLIEKGFSGKSLTGILRLFYKLDVEGRTLEITPLELDEESACYLESKKGKLALSSIETLYLNDSKIVKWEESIHLTGIKLKTRAELTQ